MCATTRPISLSKKRNITLYGSALHKSGLTYTGSTGVALSLIGAGYIGFHNFTINTQNNTNPPFGALAVGRPDNVNSYGDHDFDKVWVEGYATGALVYCVASEGTVWTKPNIRLYGGGAKYALYISQDDSLSLGGLRFETMLGFTMTGAQITTAYTGLDGAAVYIDGKISTGNISIRDSYIQYASGHGTTIHSNGTGANAVNGPITLDSIRYESTGKSISDLFLDGPDGAYNRNLNVVRNTFTSSVAAITQSANTTVQGGVVFGNSMPNAGATLDAWSDSFVIADNAITFGNNLNYSLVRCTNPSTPCVFGHQSYYLGSVWQDASDGIEHHSTDIQARHFVGYARASAGPRIRSGFGASPSIAGTDGGGRIEVGTGGDTAGVVAFGVAWSTAPACIAQNETTSEPVRATATAVRLILSGTLAEADKLTWVCIGY